MDNNMNDNHVNESVQDRNNDQSTKQNSYNRNISFAKVVGNADKECDRDLFFVPTVINNEGDEVVAFEEDLVVRNGN